MAAVPGSWAMVALFALVTAFLLGLVELLRRSRKELLASKAILEDARKESQETSQALQQALRAARMLQRVIRSSILSA